MKHLSFIICIVSYMQGYAQKPDDLSIQIKSGPIISYHYALFKNHIEVATDLTLNYRISHLIIAIGAQHRYESYSVNKVFEPMQNDYTYYYHITSIYLPVFVKWRIEAFRNVTILPTLSFQTSYYTKNNVDFKNNITGLMINDFDKSIIRFGSNSLYLGCDLSYLMAKRISIHLSTIAGLGCDEKLVLKNLEIIPQLGISYHIIPQ